MYKKFCLYINESDSDRIEEAFVAEYGSRERFGQDRRELVERKIKDYVMGIVKVYEEKDSGGEI